MEFESLVEHWQTKSDSFLLVHLLLNQGLRCSALHIDKFDCLDTCLYNEWKRVDVKARHELSEKLGTVACILILNSFANDPVLNNH